MYDKHVVYYIKILYIINNKTKLMTTTRLGHSDTLYSCMWVTT